jgi:hypothetical protein
MPGKTAWLLLGRLIPDFQIRSFPMWERWRKRLSALNRVRISNSIHSEHRVMRNAASVDAWKY